MAKTNKMKEISIAKVTLNIGAGKNEDMLNKGVKLLQKLSPIKPVKTFTKKRIPGWGLRPGLAIGAKATIRKDTEELLKRLFLAKEKRIANKSFDEMGNMSFGIHEYIDIGGLEYDPELKILGLEVAITLERTGYRVKKRRIRPTNIGKNQQVTKEQAIAFIQEKFGVEVY